MPAYRPGTPKHALDRLDQLIARLGEADGLVARGGVVTSLSVSHCRISGLPRDVSLGDCVHVDLPRGAIRGEIVAVDKAGATVTLFEASGSVRLDSVAWRRSGLSLRPNAGWKGRVLNALGEPIDLGGPVPDGPIVYACDHAPPAALERNRTVEPVTTGVRVIDLFAPMCRGQRVGIFAGSGIGKSTLLAMLARASGFDSIVVGLVGERGREVREFVEEVLGATRTRAVSIVATGDESAMMRRLAPKTATCVAEALRDAGEHVLLVIDSMTRFAHAARDVALAAGEPPVARGYPPSVFSDLPRLLERAGMGAGGIGSITALYSVLVDGDDHNDPVADSIRGTLDGHIVLSRQIAERGQFPAVDVLASISRLAHHCRTREQAELVRSLRAMIARFEDSRDIRMLGGYRQGSDLELDAAVRNVPLLYSALVQGPADKPSTDAIAEIAGAMRSAQQTTAAAPASTQTRRHGQ